MASGERGLRVKVVRGTGVSERRVNVNVWVLGPPLACCIGRGEGNSISGNR
ncbi:hypothetical protein SBDP1_260008 [Syntrophobacter sp. SbD1]|nr:hypothetical protein SBDP1_260008 [Syntrophobacter sp. SbD1]